MIATFEAFDEMFEEVTRRAATGASAVNDSARRYVSEVSAVNRDQLAAMDHLQQTLIRSVFDIQSASIQLSRSVLDAATQINRAVFQWAVAVIYPWPSLGSLTEAYSTAERPAERVAEPGDDPPSKAGDYIMSALRFQGPMGAISSGMSENED